MTPESSAGIRTSPFSAVDPPAAEPARWLAAVLLAMLWLAAAVLLWRRLAGALESRLELPALLAVATVGAGTAAAVVTLWRLAGRSSSSPWPDRLMRWASPAALGVIAAALSLP